jgi:nucleoside-diphosphate-sugar epimerase
MVTGGAGFIGSHLCEHLLRTGRRVIVVDNLSRYALYDETALAKYHAAYDINKLLEGLSKIEQ